MFVDCGDIKICCSNKASDSKMINLINNSSASLVNIIKNAEANVHDEHHHDVHHSHDEE
jgi:hypothetical protein